MGAYLWVLADQGAVLAGGVSMLLLGGVVAMRLQRSPLHRQRLGELTLGCTLLWVVLACVPLPRWSGTTEAPTAPRTLQPPATKVRPTKRMPTPAPGSAPPQFANLDAAETQKPAVAVAAAPAGPVRLLAPAPPVQPAPPLRPLSRSRNVRAVLAAIYATGSLAVTTWLFLGAVLLARLVRRAVPAPGWLEELLASLDAARDQPPRLLVSRACSGPLSCGLLRPTVLLPARMVRAENVEQLRPVLLHELAHVRRRDAWGNALLNLAMPVLYAHPLYWLVRRDVHLARELVADDWAAARAGKSSYVAELLALARAASGRGTADAAGSVALFNTPSHFYRRMHMLMQRHEPLATNCSRAWRWCSAAAFGAALAAAVALAGVRPARAQDRPANQDDARRDNNEVLRKKLAETQAALADVTNRLDVVRTESAANDDQNKLREVQLRSQLDTLTKQQSDLATLKSALDQETAAAQTPDQPVSRRGESTPGAQNSLNRRPQDPFANALPSLGAGGGRTGEIDLMALAVGYVDASGEARAARLRLDRIRQLSANNNVTTLEVEEHEAALQTTERKVKLLRAMIEIAIRSAKTELQTTTQLAKKGFATEADVAQAMAKLEILELIMAEGR